MNMTQTRFAAVLLAAAALTSAAHAATPAQTAKPGKMVPLYQAAKCHMYYTPRQAKIYHYVCPDSKGKMTKVMVTPSVAKTETTKTNALLKAGDKPFQRSCKRRQKKGAGLLSCALLRCAAG